MEDFWGSDCPGRGHVPLFSLQSLNTIPQCSYLLDPDLNIHSSREKYLGGTIPVSFRQTVPTDMELYLRRYDLSSSMCLLILIEFEIMENREIISKPDQSLEFKLEDLITSVKRSKKRLEKIDNKIIDENLQNLFKDVEQDLYEAVPCIVAVSIILGMVICRVLRYWKKEIPILTSDVETLEILDKVMEFELPIDPSIWEGIKSATRILQDTITKEQQKRLRNLLHNL